MFDLCWMMCFATTARAAEVSRFPTNEDLRHFRSISDPRISPNGQQVLIRIVDSTADGAKSHLWLVDVASNTYRQLTYSPETDKNGETNGEWMPDGDSILFQAHRGEHAQLLRLPMRGGEAKPYDLKVVPPVDSSKLPEAVPLPSGKETPSNAAEPLPLEIKQFEIAPDGKTIAVIANDPKTPGEKKQTDAKADAVWVNHEVHGARLYPLDAESEKLKLVPVAPDVRHAAWTTDSSRLFVITEGQNGEGDLHPAASAWDISISDLAHPKKLNQVPATIHTGRWSLDCSSILLHAQARQDAPPGYHDLFAYDLAKHSLTNLTDGYAGSLGPGDPWALRDGGVVQLMSHGVDTRIARLVNGRLPAQDVPLPVSVVGALHTNATQSAWVFLCSGGTQPMTLYYATGLDATPKVLTTPAIAPPGLRSVGAKRIHWKSDNYTIEGLLNLPPESHQRRVPLIVQVHGGPTGAYEDRYEPFVHFLVGHGWAVLRTNPRGSSNYGAAFAAANKNDLGGGDYRDIMAGVDCVLKTEQIDHERMALEGYSYGGEMAGFVEGKTTRFKAIISGAPVVDQYSEYGTEGDSWYDRWFYGKPWEHPADAWRQSPLATVSHAKAPFLLLQGETDTSDPLGQSQEMYRALRQMNVPVDLVTYPRENHGPLARGVYGNPVTEPWHGYDARARIVRFLQRAFGEKTD